MQPTQGAKEAMKDQQYGRRHDPRVMSYLPPDCIQTHDLGQTRFGKPRRPPAITTMIPQRRARLGPQYRNFLEMAPATVAPNRPKGRVPRTRMTKVRAIAGAHKNDRGYRPRFN